jgi:hypothetical protein
MVDIIKHKAPVMRPGLFAALVKSFIGQEISKLNCDPL